jgi:hypothetical protein
MKSPNELLQKGGAAKTHGKANTTNRHIKYDDNNNMS